jgi:hypothetical protein
MKKLVVVFLFLFAYTANAQVARKVVVEHFTNTYCSVCASRNPGFYSNLWQFPQVLHLAIHPSSPYPSCPLNQHNKAENDTRTNYYGVFGSTPRLVIQGKALASNTNYGDASIFQNELNKMSDFQVSVNLYRIAANEAEVRVVVKKVAANALTNLHLFGAIAEDTIAFNANNGETKHYDVFRKSLWNIPHAVTAPVNVGDSSVYVANVVLKSEWGKIYAIAMIQNSVDKEVLQAERSLALSVAALVSNTEVGNKFVLYPNPVMSTLFTSENGYYNYAITDPTGRVVKYAEAHRGGIDISGLLSGTYFIAIHSGDNIKNCRFVKQ